MHDYEIMSIDPSITQELPAEAVQRVLFVTPKVHVYSIPPLTSNKGHKAASWTNNPPMATVRMRLVETAIPREQAQPNRLPSLQNFSNPTGSMKEMVKTTILLEDVSSGELFAAAPYVHPTSVQQALDSSRFFAVRVEGDGGRKATLGVGFEDRSDAFDFGVALQDANKVLGFNPERPANAQSAEEKSQTKTDYSLKEGETIKIELGGRARRSVGISSKPPNTVVDGITGSGTMPILAPPPSAKDVRKSMEVSEKTPTHQTASDLGFDDGDFGEFQ